MKAAESPSGRTVALLGAKGGVGCSLLSAALASLWCGNGKSVTLARLGDDADETDLLFPKDPRPRTVRLPDAAAVDRVAFAEPPDYLLLDCSLQQPALLGRVLRLADVVLVAVTPDLLALRSLPLALRKVAQQGVGAPRTGVVMNREGLAGGVPSELARDALRLEFLGVLPDSPGEIAELVKSGFSPDGRWMASVRTLLAQLEQKLTLLPPLPLAAREPGRITGSDALPPPKHEILRALVRRLGHLDRREDPAVLRRRVAECAAGVVKEMISEQDLTRQDREAVVSRLVDEVLGLGALEQLVRDPEVTEVMINGPGRVYVERGGRIKRVACRFQSSEEIVRLVDRVVAPLGRRIDESSPMVDARLPDGSRLNAVIPPLALDGPIVTIRRFGVKSLTMEDLVNSGTLSESLARRLREAVVTRRNILVSGGAGTGKTTLLNALSGFIPPEERIVTIEDAAELRLQQDHVVRLEARPPNLEGQGAVSIRDLVRNALRMRPDRIIVGEVRGPEALDMLQAMNTGHSGSMATIHANTARDALSRIETMALMANVSLPLRVLREQVAAAVHLVVHLERTPTGERRVAEAMVLSGVAGGRYLSRQLDAGDRGGKDDGTSLLA